MATHPHAWAAVGVVLLLALAALLWRPGRLVVPAGTVRLARSPAAAAPPARAPAPVAPPQPDALLDADLRHTLELLLLEAGEAGDPYELKQRLAGRIGAHFPAALAVRALALAGRYVDYRMALGASRAPQRGSDPAALRQALQARAALRLQFFDEAERDALFAAEDALDRYTLARLEAVLDPGLDAPQRAQALQSAEVLLSQEQVAERSAVTAHLAAAAQTAEFDARQADPAARHAARSARWGEGAARALAALDGEEQRWQQRLEAYSLALAQPGSDAAALRRQWFSAQELPRIDAALALRQLAPPAQVAAAPG